MLLVTELPLPDPAISTVFQPTVDMAKSTIFSHEALVRGPIGGKHHTHGALFKLAREQGSADGLQVQCVIQSLKTWSELGQGGRVFVGIRIFRWI